MRVQVSAIVPLYNEENHISDCLESIVSQDFPKETLEVILVEGHSTDETRKIINAYRRNYRFIRILENPQRSVPKAMNLGIAAARGEVIIRMDAHCTYEASYISSCLESLKQTQADNVGGPMRAVGTNYQGKAIAAAHHSAFGLGGGKFHDDQCEGYVDTVYLGAFRKEIFRRVGFYNERLARNQDIELNSRIIRQGGRIYLNPKTKSYYYSRSRLTDLWKQNFENGKWCVYTMFVNRNALSLRHFVPLLFVSCLISLTLLGLMITFFKTLLIMAFASYSLCACAFAAQAGLKKGIRFIPFLPVVFGVLHVSYGIGSLHGLLTVRKWLKSK